MHPKRVKRPIRIEGDIAFVPLTKGHEKASRDLHGEFGRTA